MPAKVDNRSEAKKKSDSEFMNRVTDHETSVRVEQYLLSKRIRRKESLKFESVQPMPSGMEAFFKQPNDITYTLPIAALGMTTEGRAYALVFDSDELKSPAELPDFLAIQKAKS